MMDFPLTELIIGFFGACLGAFVTFLTNLYLRQYDAKYKMKEKLLDRRLQAYKELLEFIRTLYLRCLIEGTTEDGYRECYPSILEDNDRLNKYMNELVMISGANSIYYNNALHKTLHFLQSYMLDLNKVLKGKSAPQWHQIGVLLRDDFDTFALELETEVQNFFNDELLSLDSKVEVKSRKFPTVCYENWLSKTELFKNRKLLQRI